MVSQNGRNVSCPVQCDFGIQLSVQRWTVRKSTIGKAEAEQFSYLILSFSLCTIRLSNNISSSRLSPKQKGKLVRSLNKVTKGINILVFLFGCFLVS